MEFWIQIIINLVTIAFFAGIVWTKLNYIENKQDKHNDLIERMYHVEEAVNKAHTRIDNMEDVRG